MFEMFHLEAMRHAFIAAVLVGAAAPAVGVFLVQRRLSLIGDGVGHVALAGVAIGVLTGNAPTWTALVTAVLAACAIEALRVRGRTNADVALSVMFYGGIALGVVLLAKAPAEQGVSMNTYLFGSILTTQADQLWQFAVLAIIAVGLTVVLRKRFFAVANDEEFARAAGMPVLVTNLLLSVLTSVTVVMSMRVIGLLLISALMILPNATGQHLGRSFRACTVWAVIIGIFSGAFGVVSSYQLDTPSGGTIVLTAVVIFLLVASAESVRRTVAVRRARNSDHPHRHFDGCGHPAVLHADHVDYVHDGHRHAAHEDHWDEHADGHAGKHAAHDGSRHEE